MSNVGATSAGIMMYRRTGESFEVLIGHPGGPFWKNKQEGAWSIPKGMVDPEEPVAAAARREFAEETGHPVGTAELVELGSAKLRSGKTVLAWATEGDLEPTAAISNNVVLEWPRGSGRTIEFPEIDYVRWCSAEEAKRLLNPAQRVFVDRLQEYLDHPQ